MSAINGERQTIKVGHEVRLGRNGCRKRIFLGMRCLPALGLQNTSMRSYFYPQLMTNGVGLKRAAALVPTCGQRLSTRRDCIEKLYLNHCR